MKITLGTDPEFFLMPRSAKGGRFSYVSAHDLIPGTKTEPFKMKTGQLQADGTSVEFNTVPASSGKEFQDNVLNALNEIRGMIPKDYAFKFVPAIEYSKDYFNALPEKVRELGCDPDFIPANGLVGPTPVRSSYTPTLCTGSGHLHIGWTEGKDIKDMDHFNDARVVAQAMFNTFIYLRNLWDMDTLRHSLYGNLGQYRPKPYGVESRFLSNAWLNYPDLYPWLFDMTQTVVDRLEKEGRVPVLSYETYSGNSLNDANRALTHHGYPTIPTNFKKNALTL